MTLRRCCPKCHEEILITISTPPFSVRIGLPQLKEGTKGDLTDRIVKILERAGKRGLTIRELQRSLGGILKAEEIATILNVASEDSIVETEARGRAVYHMLKTIEVKEEE